MSNVYGYWVSKNEIIDVPTYAHAQVAEEVLKERHGIPPEAVWSSPFNFYQFMFKLGYIRVINEPEGVCVQYHESTKLSRLQKQFIKEARETGRIYEDSDNVPLDDLVIANYTGVQSRIQSK